MVEVGRDWMAQINKLVENPTVENRKKLRWYLLNREDSWDKHAIPKYAARMFLYFGEDGIRELAELMTIAPGAIYPNSILHTIYATSKKGYVFIPFIDESSPETKHPPITDDLAKKAEMTFFDIIVQSRTDFDLFNQILTIFQNASRDAYFGGNPESVTKDMFGFFQESTIKINPKMILEFENLLAKRGATEEEYQIYLSKYPVFIDPLAKEIIPKQKLGIEYITDFVVRKLNDEYIIVEIEKPDTHIFTNKNDFSSRFTHAIGQVIDFQEWVESNIAYAQKLMPNIVSPVGLVIIGRRNKMTEFQCNKLRRFNLNNQHKLIVITFDDVIDNAKRLYGNITDI